MGLSASQARFLQLTARKSDTEYQMQQISYARLEWSQKLQDATLKYQEKMNNKKMVFTFTGNEGKQQTVDVTYNNYKNYMNQQLENLAVSQPKYYLVSSSGNKIVAGSQDDMQKMIENNDQFTEDDFIIVDGLGDTDHFQQAIQDGTYYFATYEKRSDGEYAFQTNSWDTLGAGAISEVYDESDDNEAEAEYQASMSLIQNADKKLEMELDRLESERDEIKTEMDSVEKIIKDNIENTFNAMS